MIDTGAFFAGVGVLVTLDVAVLGISVANARAVGVDKTARQKAEKALKKSRKARRAVRRIERETGPEADR